MGVLADPSMINPIRTRDTILDEELRSARQEVERLWGTDLGSGADLVSYFGEIDDPGAGALKAVLEDIRQDNSNLIFNIETYGGFVESAERMVNIMRHHYEHVDFIITTFAMSAGTVLAMSGDRIWMDYSSTLGPIDPQVRQAGTGPWVPALGYLEQYKRLVEGSRAGTLSPAEITYMVEKFDPAELYQYEQSRDLSIALIEEWLVKYKFRAWGTTETHKKKVTAEMKTQRAAQIARILNDTALWHSHSRGISMDAAQDVLELRIDDMGVDDDDGPISEKRDALSRYNSLLFDHRVRRGHESLIIDSKAGYYGS